MTPTQAGALMRRARMLLRSGDITHHQLTLMDCMVWSCRTPGSDRLTVSYSRLQRLAHMARDTIARGLARLEDLGLFRKVKRRVKMTWGRGVASRQATNMYVLSTESAEKPVFIGRVLRKRGLNTKTPAVERGSGKKAALDDALRRLGERIWASERSHEGVPGPA